VTSYRCQIFSAVTAIEIHLIFASSLNILIREPRRRLTASAASSQPRTASRNLDFASINQPLRSAGVVNFSVTGNCR
jgi:hypothetical protein